MLKITFILVAFGTFITCFADTIPDDDWKKKGFYRPRRNYQTQTQIRNSPQPWRQNNLNATRETGFRQNLETPSTNAFGASNSRNVQHQNLFQRTSYNHNPQNSFGSSTDTSRTSFNQNIRRQNSFATSYSQKQDQNLFVNQHSENQNSFGASPSSFGNSYDLRNQNLDPIGAGNNQKRRNSNVFQTSRQNHPNQNLFGSATNQNFQRQNSFVSGFGQNEFSYQNFGSNQQIANSGSFGSSNQNTFKGYDYIPPRDKFKPPFVGPTYLPPLTTTTKRPFRHGTGTDDAAPAMAMLVPPEPEDDPTPTTTVVVTTPSTTTTTTTTPFDREPSEIFPETMTRTYRPFYAPAMAMPVPPEPEDDPTPTTTVVVTTPSTTTTTTPFDREPSEIFPETMTRTNRPFVAPAMAMPVPPEPEDEPTTTTTVVVTTPSTTTTTTTTPFDREPSEIFPETMTTTNRPIVPPAMAMPVPPEPEDEPTPTTTPSTTTSTTTTTPPITTSTPSTTTPEPNRVLIEETSPMTTTTKRPIITTPTTTTTTEIVTAPTTPTTPYFKAPEYLPPETPQEVPPPAPAMAIPVVPECDPSDPSTYASGIDLRYTGGDPCNPTTTTPEPNPTEEPNTPTLAMAIPVVPECDPSDPSTYPSGIYPPYTGGDPCNPTTTTPEPNRSEEPTTPTTTTRKIVSTPRKVPPVSPAMAIPVVPECDPSDPNTYAPGIDPRYNVGDPCNPTTTTPEPNRSGEPTTPTTTTRIITTSTTPTPHFKAPEYLPPLNMTKILPAPAPAPARAMPVPEPECDPSDPSTYPLGANPCTVPPSCIAPSVLPQGPKKRAARAVPSGRTLRLGDLTGVPRPVWYVGIYDKTFTPHYKPICGGSVLTMDVVISAGHCFWDSDSLLPAADFAVGANKIYRPWADKMDKKAQKSDVKEVIVPPRYRGAKTSFQDDIAILKLVTPFRYAPGLRPLCVNFDEDFEEEQLKEGHSGTFAGWGATNAEGAQTSRLLWLELPFVQIDRCIAGYPEDFIKYITSDKMCAGETNTGKALCGGDSGGGLIFWHGEPHNAVPYLRGIASTAPRADLLECNVQVVGTFTQISWHRRFLRKHVPGLGDECHFRD